MSRHAKVLELLKAQGYRITPQRVLVLEAISEHQGHMQVEEILRRVQQDYPYIDVATVYRTLQLLKRLHLVTEIETGGSARYELTADGGHHHMVCRQCGRAFNLSPSYLEELRQRLIKEFGFEPDLQHFTLSGRCADCAASAPPTP